MISVLVGHFEYCAPVGAGDFDDRPEYAHAMDIRTIEVDGFPVVTHYGKIRPDFADRNANPHRSRQPLDNRWLFRFDPNDVGIEENWAAGSDTHGWTDVTLPHCWDVMEGGRFWDWSDQTAGNPPFYDGVAWYRCNFDSPFASDRAHRIEFLGIPHRVRLYLNGQPIAMHEGGGQPFSIDVTDQLRAGSNTLAVRIVRLPNYREKSDGAGFEELFPVHTRHPKAPDNWPYAGIPRSIAIVSEDPAAIRKLLVRPVGDVLEGAVCLSNEGRQTRSITVSLESPVIQSVELPPVSLEPGQMRVLRFSAELKTDAARWSPASPNLHTLTAVASDHGTAFDTLRTNFGLRDFRIEGDRFLLDDQPLFLKGVAFYEEHPERGNALLPEDHENMFQRVRDAHASFARLHVAQRHPLTYDLADRHGIVLCAEWGGFWYTEKSMDVQTRDDRSIFQSLARCAVWDLMNHPSVVMWGIHNESHQFCPQYEPFVKKGHQLVDHLDWQKRPVTWAAWHPHKGQPHFEHADVVGFNEYRGAMDAFEDLEPDMQRTASENPGKPIVIMENGGWSRRGNRGPKDRQNTEDWQADLLRRQHKVLTAHIPPLAGYTYWLLVDYRSRKPYTGNRRSDGWSRMGLYDAFGQPKLVRDVFRELQWSTTPSKRGQD